EYRINGAIYICNVEYFKKHRSFYKEKSYPYIMKREDSIDIDTLFDFSLAEFILKNKGVNS
ncbi:MAG: CMP-N-acetlyneuraminic acid synthetase, partial [Clostridium sp.]